MERDDPMTTRAPSTSLAGKKRGIGVGLLLTLVAIGGYFLRERHDGKANVVRAAHVDTETLQQSAAVASATEEAAPALPAMARPNRAPMHHAVDEANSAEAHVTETHPPSHPIDAQRQRIYRENNFHAAMMSAMNQSDVPGLRALVAEYRSAYPEDEFQLQEGYSLVANCLDQLTAERQEQARHYWRTNRSSTVRRFIRRYCLERSALSG